jgi:RNA polymerase sigma-70 factor, ECF subfamily
MDSRVRHSRIADQRALNRRAHAENAPRTEQTRRMGRVVERSAFCTARSEGAPSSGRPLEPAQLAQHYDRLFRAAYGLAGSREDAEDLVQETYARVLRRPRVLRRSGELAYLMGVLRNVWRDSTSARRAQTAASVEDVEFVADRRADPDALLEARAAYAAIAELSLPLRETIVAVDILGLSYKEAARALGTGEGTIMSRLYNARRNVAAALGDTAP